jgi:hypothetical protein
LLLVTWLLAGTGAKFRSLVAGNARTAKMSLLVSLAVTEPREGPAFTTSAL